MSSEKRTAVVVGATGNIGGAISAALEKANFSLDPVWMSDKRPDSTKRESYQSLPSKIHAAIYVAGINEVCAFEDLSEESWDRVFNVNLKGAFLFAQAALPAMKAAQSACFISISSIMVTHPYPNRLPYAASKAGLEAMTKCMAVEWGQYGISSHCLRLGHVTGLMKSTKTNPKLLDSVKKLTPSGRLTQPEEVGSYVAWLASGGASALNGSVIDFDPGYTINRWPLYE